jgi:hypothetical protein
MSGSEFANPRLEAHGFGWPDLEAPQNAAQAQPDIMKLCLQQFARGEQRARLLRGHGLAMHRAEPAEPHQLRDPARV